jgi:hypothetical protein
MKKIRHLLAAGIIGFAGFAAAEDVSFTCIPGPNIFNGPFTVLDGIQGGTWVTNLFAGASNGSLAEYYLNFDGTPGSNYNRSRIIAGFWSPNIQLPPGIGFWVNCVRTNTFHWTVNPSSPPPALLLVSNIYSFRGSVTNAPATYQDIAGAPPQEDTSLFRYVGPLPGFIFPNVPPVGTNWQAYNFQGGVWTPTDPVMNPLEAVFIVYPTLRVSITSTSPAPQQIVTWPRGMLQSSATPTGPWLTLSNATAPYVVDPSTDTNGMNFFRAGE